MESIDINNKQIIKEYF